MRISSTITAVAAILGVGLLAGCTGTPGEAGSGDATFIKAIGNDPGSLDALHAVSPEAREAISYAYESLVVIDGEGEASPWLADGWEIGADTATFSLKPGITCSDGTPFTAETVAANINYHAVADNASFYYGSLVKDGTVAEAVDDTTVEVSLPSTDAFLLSNIGSIQLVCQSGLDDPESLATATAGTGLYVLTEAIAEDRYTFELREDHDWAPDGVTSETEGLPKTVELRVIQDESTRVNLLLAEEISAAGIEGPDRARLEAAGLFSAGPSSPVGEIMFNEKSDRLLADPVLREALVTALDREQIREVLTEGQGTVPTSLVTLTPFACVNEEAPWSLPDTDPGRSGELLDEAGWTAGADGVRTRDGRSLDLVFIYDAANPTAPAASELIAEAWTSLGADVELVPMAGAAWDERLFQNFSWDAGFLSVTSGEPSFVASFFTGATPPDGNNFMFVDNPEYAALAAQAGTAGPEEACSLWTEAEKVLVERFDVLPTANLQSPVFGQGVEFVNNGFIEAWSIRMAG